MSAKLEITTLGQVQLSRDGESKSRDLTSKAIALFIFLAVTAKPHSREQLAALLWGDMPEAEAQTNLRKALSSLRHVVAEHLVFDKHTVAFDRTQPYVLDAEELSADRAANIKELYQGDFLATLGVKHAPDFEAWVVEQREHYRALAVRRLEQRAQNASEHGETDAALDALDRLLALDEWNENAHRQKMLLLARGGEKLKALAQYQTVRKILRDEFGVEPSPETTALFERIRSARPLAAPLPALPTRFIGRADECAALSQMLAQPTTRLVTLLGPGGVGKTRLALEIARSQAAHFLHGAAYLALLETDGAQSLAFPLGAAFGLTFARASEPMVQLGEFLRDKELLLVLDNFELAVARASELAQLLQNAPEVKLLVASRERLALQWEQLFPLRGLAFPHVVEQTDADADALVLFAERARRFDPAFALSQNTAPGAVRIARLVEGFPLALELAAGLTRTQSVDAIARDLENELGILESDLRDAAQRQSSLRAVFDSSWRMLADQERAAVRQLAVFRAGFTADAARAVAGATWSLLRGLSDKAFLWHGADERLEMHQVLREFANDELERDAAFAAHTHVRHANYYLEFLTARAERIVGPTQAQTVAELRLEWENVRAAWQTTIAGGNAAALDSAAPVLYRYLEAGALFRFGKELFEPAAERSRVARARWGGVLYFLTEFDAAEEELGTALELARAEQDSVETGFCLLQLGNVALGRAAYAKAESYYRDALTAAESLDDRYLSLDAYNNLGLVAMHRGHDADAREHFNQAAALAQALDEKRGLAAASLNLGVVDANAGDYDTSRQELERALPLFEQVGDLRGVCIISGNLGEVALVQGRLDDAEALYRRSLTLARDLALPERAASMLKNLGTVELRRQQLQKARLLYQESLETYQRIGTRRGECFARIGLGDVALAANELPRAFQEYSAALVLGREIDAVPRALDALNGIARVAERQGKETRALAIYVFVSQHQAADSETRALAQTHRERLEARLEKDAVQAAHTSAGQVDFLKNENP